jgi:hypothetical protein
MLSATRKLGLTTTLAIPGLLPETTWAQPFPSRPLKIVVGLEAPTSRRGRSRPPGGDTFRFLVQDYLERYARKNTAPGSTKETKRVLESQGDGQRDD